MRIYRLVARIVLIAVAACGLTACGSPPPPKPAVLELMMTGSADLNPNDAGTSQPVAVYLYQLAATQKFANADVFALIEHEQKTLGADDLGSTTVILKPSDRQDVKQDLKAGTTAIGVVVGFHAIDQAKWRAFAPVETSGTSKLVLEVQKLSVSLKPATK